MSILQISHLSEVFHSSYAAKRSWWRLLLLVGLLLLSLVLYVWMRAVAPPDVERTSSFMLIWILSFVPYFAACAFVLLTRPLVGRWGWLELGIILVGALLMRSILLPLPPNLSHDSWRYLWDARVTLLGYSPYVYAPGDPLFIHLRDFIFQNSRFRNVPTIYPPGAQAVYLLSYLLAPSNLYVLKGIFLIFDVVTCGALALFLYRHGLDPRRTIIYAWCPLPIIEFAIQGHVDVITLTFTMLAILSSMRSELRWRILTGFLIGVATLTKIYPILLLVVVLRPQRRDMALLTACFATILIGYIPYSILGHGQVFGFFSKYASEQGTNAGMVQLMGQWVGQILHLRLQAAVFWEHVIDLIAVCVASLVVLALRWRGYLSIAAATLIIYSTALAISSHVFPWYTTTLLPWIAVLVGPLWKAVRGGRPGRLSGGQRRGDGETRKRLSGKHIAVTIAWYFVCVSLIGYFFDSSNDWRLYYAVVYDVVLAGLAVAAISGLLWTVTRAKSFERG